MSYGEESSREMMTESMNFCGADRQSPFQDPLTPLFSDQNGQDTLSGELLKIYSTDADAHRSITTFLKKRLVNIRSYDNEIRVVNIDHRVANSAIY
ncbi:hypothetical protein CEXT_215231 [Caerostris extrusa]|uniref:Uncharacterized protein n=1 Tax=Caerostris extrusa TaxID=172846 RepID=A0AAV4PLK3_CAEEX|nr:hypothetical protein CEXT_215231 [Caerostris extrusa]